MRGGEKEVNIDKLSEGERGYLWGLFEGDGYKTYHKKSRHYIIEFYLNSKKDKLIIKKVFSLLKEIGLNPSQYKDKRFNCIRVKAYSKKLFNLMNKRISLKDKNNDFNLGYVSGIIDSEGYVNQKKHTIEIVNTNKDLLDQCANFLDSINIGYNLSKRSKSIKDKKDSYRMYVSVSFKRLKHLSIKVAGNLE